MERLLLHNMPTNKLVNIFFLSTLLIIAHMLEEWFSGFYNIFPFILYLVYLFQTTQRAVFGTFILMSWLLLFVILGFLSGRKWIRIILCIFGIIFIFELHHPIRAIFAGTYYPGAITGAVFPFLGFFFWRELLKNWKKL